MSSLNQKLVQQLVICLVGLALGCSPRSDIDIKDPKSRETQSKGDLDSQAKSSARPGIELLPVLTNGTWIKDLGEGAFLEQWVYRFNEDGTYTQQIISDFSSSPVTGKWKLTKTDDQTYQLALSNLETGEYYWLGEQSFVRYDRKSDSLVITGPRYDGEQLLRHRSDD